MLFNIFHHCQWTELELSYSDTHKCSSNQPPGFRVNLQRPAFSKCCWWDVHKEDVWNMLLKHSSWCLGLHDHGTVANGFFIAGWWHVCPLCISHLPRAQRCMTLSSLIQISQIPSLRMFLHSTMFRCCIKSVPFATVHNFRSQFFLSIGDQLYYVILYYI